MSLFTPLGCGLCKKDRQTDELMQGLAKNSANAYSWRSITEVHPRAIGCELQITN